jgi:hypothetical protein
MNTLKIPPLELINSSQILNTSWSNLGLLQNVEGYTTLGLFLKIDINNSANLEVRAIGKTSKTSIDDYILNIVQLTDYTNAIVKTKTGSIQMDNDVDQNLILEIVTLNLVPYVQIQVKVGTVGATAAEILEAFIAKSWVGR